MLRMKNMNEITIEFSEACLNVCKVWFDKYGAKMP